MSIWEESHYIHIVQDIDPDLHKSKTNQELNWQNTFRQVMLILSTSTYMIINTEFLVLTSMESGDVVSNLTEKTINVVNSLHRGYFVLMQNMMKGGGHFYISEVLDIYKKGMSSWHCSINIATLILGLLYLSLHVFLPITLVSMPISWF